MKYITTLLWMLFAWVMPISPVAAAFAGQEDGVEAVSFMGEPIMAQYSDQPKLLAQYEAAKTAWQAQPDNVMAHIWYGRRTAYLGRYKEAIDIFSAAIKRFPEDARLYRHRGHRYISIRMLDEAIADYEKAAELIAGQENAIEPDGMPNAQNIPLTTTHGNIWYHMGLAYYLNQDWQKAYDAFTKGFNLKANDDNLVSTGHWRYMILRRMGQPEAALKAIEAITPKMTIIENDSYHKLCLFYKGLIDVAGLGEIDAENPSNASMAYGVAHWYYYNGQKAKAKAMMLGIMKGGSKMSFGYIAAENDLAKADWS